MRRLGSHSTLHFVNLQRQLRVRIALPGHRDVESIAGIACEQILNGSRMSLLCRQSMKSA